MTKDEVFEIPSEDVYERPPGDTADYRRHLVYQFACSGLPASEGVPLVTVKDCNFTRIVADGVRVDGVSLEMKGLEEPSE